MAYGAKKDRGITKTKRFSALPICNIKKQNALKTFFQFTYYLKNSISFDVFNKKELLLTSDGKNVLKKDGYKEFNNNPFLRSWETQKIYQQTVDFYDNSLVKIFKNNHFKLQKKIKAIKYKRIVKNKKNEIIFNKGDLKSREMIYKNTSLSNLMNWLLYIEGSKLDVHLKMIPINGVQKNIDNTIDFNKRLVALRKSPLWSRVKVLIIQRKARLLTKIKCIEYSTGSFMRQAKDNNTDCSRLFKDETNSTYQWWYCFKQKNLEDIYVPVAVNKNFHNEDFDFEAIHYVSLSSKGRLNIGATYEVERPYKIVDTIDSKNLVGIDLNVASNLCSISYQDKDELIDYDRTAIKKSIELLKSLEAKGYKQHEIKDKKQLMKLFGTIEFEMKEKISYIIRHLIDQGITDIVMEDLNLTNTTASMIINEELNIKYSKLVRFLRLSSIKTWFKEQANNRGIRVHLTTPSYTSQQCSECDVIIKGNRNQRFYECQNCGFKIDADNNASRNIRGRLLLSNVLVTQLHILESGQLIPKRIKRETLKKMLTKHLEIVDNECQHPHIGFKRSENSRETPTIINLLI